MDLPSRTMLIKPLGNKIRAMILPKVPLAKGTQGSPAQASQATLPTSQPQSQPPPQPQPVPPQPAHAPAQHNPPAQPLTQSGSFATPAQPTYPQPVQTPQPLTSVPQPPTATTMTPPIGSPPPTPPLSSSAQYPTYYCSSQAGFFLTIQIFSSWRGIACSSIYSRAVHPGYPIMKCFHCSFH